MEKGEFTGIISYIEIEGNDISGFRERRWVMGLHLGRMGNIVFGLVGMLLLVLSFPAAAHNGAVAIAVPVEEITIDGDLSDWVEDMQRYPIQLHEVGDPPASEDDFKGSFRIGYNEQENALYVAVEVQDESVIKESQGEVSWDTQETCEIYLFVNETGSKYPTQYFLKGDLLGVFGRELKEDEVEAAVTWHEKSYQYEWKIKIEKATNGKIQVHPDLMLGFDISLWDKDEDESASWYAWSKGGKLQNPLNVGFAYLVVNEMVLDPSIIQLIKNVIEQTNRAAKRVIRRNTILQMVSSVVPFSFAVLHLLLFLFYSRLRENLYYSLFLVNIAIYSYLTIWILELSGLLDIIRILAFIFQFSAGLRFLYSVFYTQLPKQFWILGFGVIGVGILSFFVWNTLILYLWTVAGLAVIIEVLRVILSAIFRKKEGAWIIGLGFLFLCLLGIKGFLQDMGVPVGSPQYDDYLFPAGLLSVILSMSIYLARQFGHTSKNLETQLVQVKELSAQALEQERRIREEEVQRQLLEEELNTAHDMQMSLMPTESPQIEGFDIAGRCTPANHVGGDFFQYYPQDGRLAISMADVTGHAMEAAIPVVMFSGILESQIEIESSLEELFTRLNRTLHKTLTDSRTFVCFTMGELNTVNRFFRLSNGGCPYPFHFKAASKEIIELQIDAYPLGVRLDTSYQAIEVQLQTGDYIVFCSDGIIEAANEAEEIFGFERTAELIRKGCAEDLTAEALIEQTMDEVKTFSGEAAQGDDMTMVVLKVEK